ncbi:hypothetical protein F0249_03495 [Vibrio sp. 03-59-1]|uniref:hypothetical protein n=1 Tax=Vibrio sp. 03-59-1 TaxID=2607607 RepID=UPI001493CDB7|nr:hypothetical protein [Vibrio sp. 03-59-1]NOH82863.1 hypothetical protein [Vibrio sp. 03-59-1]
MKLSNVFLIFFAGVAGVLFGGLFLTIILPRFFSGELETGDMATWAAAFGTICTLGFLINQHTELREKQQNEKKEFEIERDKREEHERKQQEMWAEQKETLSFQKLQMHKLEFNNILLELERTNKFEFINKTTLYSNIFPINNFKTCETIINLDSEYRQNELQDIINKFHLLTNSFNSFYNPNTTEDQAYNHLKCLLELAYALQVRFKPEPKVGDILYDPQLESHTINIFDPIATATQCEMILIKLCDFSGNSLTSSLKYKYGKNFTDAILNLSFHKPQKEDIFISQDGLTITSMLYQCLQYFSESSASLNNSFYKTLHECFYKPNEMHSLLSSKAKLIGLVSSLREFLLSDGNPQKNTNRQDTDKLVTLLKKWLESQNNNSSNYSPPMRDSKQYSWSL